VLVAGGRETIPGIGLASAELYDLAHRYLVFTDSLWWDRDQIFPPTRAFRSMGKGEAKRSEPTRGLGERPTGSTVGENGECVEQPGPLFRHD
jgi:hypothetical protein